MQRKRFFSEMNADNSAKNIRQEDEEGENNLPQLKPDEEVENKLQQLSEEITTNASMITLLQKINGDEVHPVSILDKRLEALEKRKANLGKAIDALVLRVNSLNEPLPPEIKAALRELFFFNNLNERKENLIEIPDDVPGCSLS